MFLFAVAALNLPVVIVSTLKTGHKISRLNEYNLIRLTIRFLKKSLKN